MFWNIFETNPCCFFLLPIPKIVYSWKGILGSIGNIGESNHTEKTSLLDLESSLRWIWRRDLARSCKRALCGLNWKFWHTVCFRGAVYSIYFPTCYCKPNHFEMKTETTKTKGRYLVLRFVNYIYLYVYIYICTAGLFPINSHDTHTNTIYRINQSNSSVGKRVKRGSFPLLNIIGSDVAVRSLQFYPHISILLVMLNIVEYNVTVKLPITCLVLYPWLLFIQILWLPKPSTSRSSRQGTHPQITVPVFRLCAANAQSGAVAKDRRGTWKRRCRILAFSGPVDPP